MEELPMNTLDEVIKALEICTSDRDGCGECPYDSVCDADKKWDDALYYLKELRHILDNTVWVGSTKEESGYWKLPTLPETGNDPLTWDELRQMEGKPVWVEFLNYDLWDDPEHHTSDSWWVVGEVRKDDIIIAQYLDEAELCEEDLGDVWQAYRKERK